MMWKLTSFEKEKLQTRFIKVRLDWAYSTFTALAAQNSSKIVQVDYIFFFDVTTLICHANDQCVHLRVIIELSESLMPINLVSPII